MKNIINKILWSTIEDYVGLWEILWEVNSELPQINQLENQESTRNILKYLLDQNYVLFYSSKWGTDELKELNLNESLQFLWDEQYWNPPAINEICIKVGSTDKGEMIYNKGMEDVIL